MTPSGTLRTPASARSASRWRFPPLYERLIYYVLLPDLFSRIVLEAALGIYWYTITQPKQWVFYILLSIEYVFQIRSLLQARFRKDQSLYVALLFMTMVLHGALVGLAWGNNIAKIVTDTVPVAFAGLNVLLLAKLDAFDGFSFERLRKVNQAYAVTMVAVGMLALGAGRPTIVNLGGAVPTAVCFSIIVASLMVNRNFSLRELAILAFILVPIAPNSTRTMLVVFVIALSILFFKKIIADGRRLYFALVAAVIAAGTVPAMLPEDSPVMHRIDAILSFDPTQRTGSIGERQAESDAIDEELRRHGPIAEVFGRGHGTTYRVVFSDGRIPDNYSHAHYSWALFKLRYGQIGYIYLILFAVLLVANVVRNFRSSQNENRVAFLLGVWGVIYLVTYAFYNLFVSGLQFAHSDRLAARSPSDDRMRARGAPVRLHANSRYPRNR